MTQALRFASLGSGSKGNATLVSAGQTHILIDNGFALRDLTQRLARFELTPDDLNAVLVTHEHGDHVGGVGPLIRRHRLPVHMTYGTRLAAQRRLGQLPHWQMLTPEIPVTIGDLEVLPVTVPHDAREPCQFRLTDGQYQLGILTDLGSVTAHVVTTFQHCDSLVLEANHDPQMLAQGPYPPSLKARVAGDYGHLSNQQAAEFLQHIETGHLQHLVASHISEQNNQAALAGRVLAEALNCTEDWITLADQQQGFGWRACLPRG
ncbi:MBL fold metallo-hydrolase [Terasakiispira papahanaumokuakeensis]|uniref:MBL fold metallo-hydrolase n=1 Tax=Terasakiispira papahanaumokuakeensis TaxID=197479 RepID=A0A1E2V6I9_9GAMM|nr:MBL fold metallo-hydrolase [Terasakiispira papahanaumokuakeensis]ODC02601.1 MBL fold metallo-hydrolase [Terasakiispira papahanaumokuakeensis]